MIALILLIAVPLAEIYIFIKVGTLLGAGWTVILTLLTAALGLFFLQKQGLSTLRQAQARLDEQKAPVEEIFQGLCLLLAGALLLFPGFLTDTIGFLLFLPPVQRFALETIQELQIGLGYTVFSHFESKRPNDPPDVIEGDFIRIKDKPDD